MAKENRQKQPANKITVIYSQCVNGMFPPLRRHLRSSSEDEEEQRSCCICSSLTLRTHPQRQTAVFIPPSSHHSQQKQEVMQLDGDVQIVVSCPQCFLFLKIFGILCAISLHILLSRITYIFNYIINDTPLYNTRTSPIWYLIQCFECMFYFF